MATTLPREPKAILPEATEQPELPTAEPREAPAVPAETAVVVVNRFPAGEVTRAALIVLAVILGAGLLWVVREVLFLLFVAILIAVAIEPIVNRLRRGPFNRASGTLVVYGAIVLTVGLPAYFLLPAMSAQLEAVGDGLPGRIESLRPYAEGFSSRPVREAAVNLVDYAGGLAQTTRAPREQALVEAGYSAVNGLLAVLTVFVVAFYWLLERAAIRRSLAKAAPVRAQRVYAVWEDLEEKLGGWVRGQLMLMVTVGVISALGFFALGLPSPLLLAAIAAAAELVPVIGPLFAFGLAIVAGLTVSPQTALLTLLFGGLVQLLEPYVLAPRLMAHAVGISPLAVLVGLLAGHALFGLAGAVVAVPIAGALQVIIAHALEARGAGSA